jgi:hypothetical protein
LDNNNVVFINHYLELQYSLPPNTSKYLIPQYF